MKHWGKILGGGLGWAFGGPIGALMGVALGSMFDETDVNQGKFRQSGQQHHTGPGDFSASLLVLSAAVMKADGKILKSELNFVKDFYRRQFGPEETKQQMQILRDILEQEIPVREVCMQIRFNMRHALRLQLLHYLFGIALADGQIDATESEKIRQISNWLGISPRDFESIRAMFEAGGYGGPRTRRTGPSLDASYRILEVSPNASDEEVKKAYRRMAIKHHPDKVSSLGEGYVKGAEEKFKAVQEAWDVIKTNRGIK